MKKKLQNEALFVGFLGQCLFNEIPEDQRRELDDYFGLQSGRFVCDCNRYLERTIKALSKEIVSVRGLSMDGIQSFLKLLVSDKLDKNLQSGFRRTLKEKIDDKAQELINQAKALGEQAQGIELGVEELDGLLETEKLHQQMRQSRELKELSENLRREALELSKVSKELD